MLRMLGTKVKRRLRRLISTVLPTERWLPVEGDVIVRASKLVDS